MEPQELFGQTLQDLERLVAQGGEYSMLRAAALLRQLLMDSSPLAHQVNRGPRLKLRFEVCGRLYRDMILEDEPVFYSALEGVRAVGISNEQPESLALDEFLGFVVLKLGEQLLTIGDLISISANVLGGVHSSEPRAEKEQAIAGFNTAVRVGGHPVSAAQMKPIIEVALEGLRPLAEAIRNR